VHVLYLVVAFLIGYGMRSCDGEAENENNEENDNWKMMK
jgi:hypothetical protein